MNNLLRKFVFGISVFISTAICAQSGVSLTFSEVMFFPTENNGEFVEIYNTSKTESIDLTNFKFKYSTSASDNFVSFIGGITLGPNKYAIIIESDYDYLNGLYKNLIPADAIVIKIGDSAFGGTGMSNTASRDIYLLNAVNDIVDSYTYSANNSAGISDEKYLLTKTNLPANWINSLHLQGTPGSQNSVTPLDYNYDLGINIKGIDPQVPIEQEKILSSIIIKNHGALKAQNFTIEIFNDANKDSVAELSERIFEKNYSELAQSDSTFIEFKFDAPIAGLQILIAKVVFAADQNLLNNESIFGYTVNEIPAKYNEVVINEIMFAPSNNEPEWIEIVNNSTRSINLKNWKIGDISQLITLSTVDYKIAPNEFVVISDDASISNYHNITSKLLIKSLPLLSNTGDEVLLKSSNGISIDSVKYDQLWGGNDGKSLERISIGGESNNPANWKSSFEKLKSSPGKINSATKRDFDLSIVINQIKPGQPSIDENVTATVTIKNRGYQIAGSFGVEIFVDFNHDSVAQIDEKIYINSFNQLSVGDSLNINTTFKTIEEGNFNLIANLTYAQDENLSNNKASLNFTVYEKTALYNEIVINEIMYAPANDEPEWIELYNLSQREINIKNWKIGDNTQTVTISNSDYLIKPGEYLLISDDASITNYHSIKSRIINLAFPSLSNSGDQIILKSSQNSTIDSVAYAPDWGGTNGVSIERISALQPSTHKQNWKSSQNYLSGTPGGINSASPKQKDLAAVKLYSNSKYAVINSNLKIQLVVENRGTIAATAFAIKLYRDKNYDMNEDLSELILETQGANLESGKSKIYELPVADFVKGINTFIAKVEYAEDSFYENNRSGFEIIAVVLNEDRGDLLVNEFMSAPLSGEPEWIEIFNSSKKIIDLNGYGIANSKDTSRVIFKSTQLLPDQYYVIAKDSSIIKKYAIISKYTVSDFPSLVNNGDKIVILDSLYRTIDSLEYKSTWKATSGKSLEKIEPYLASVDSINWKTSSNALGATPGYANSFSKKNKDILVNRLEFTPNRPLAFERVTFKTEIENKGKQEASFRIYLNEIYKDGSKSKLEESAIITLPASTSIGYEFAFVIPNLLNKRILEVTADYPSDEDPSNNKKSVIIQPAYKSNSVLINEVMYNPLNGEPEWIELYNASQYDIDLEDWTISDLLTNQQQAKIAAKDYSFQHGKYLVITKDTAIINYHRFINSKIIVSGFPNLNNDADAVIIKDSKGTTIDSVGYASDWGGRNGMSLERVSLTSQSRLRSNWASSNDIELSTPGRINSLTPKLYDLTIIGIKSVPMFPSIGDQVNLVAKVFNRSIKPASSFSVEFYSKLGNKFHYFGGGTGSNLSPNDSAEVFSNFKLTIDAQKSVYCKVVYSLDEDSVNNYLSAEIIPGSKRNVIVISEIMFDPLKNETEWVEIYNNSNETINLKNWSISDLQPLPTKNQIIKSDSYLNPNSYAVIAVDSNKYQYNPPINFYQTNFGTLGNLNDGVLIYDFRGAVIDSVNYFSSWGGERGRSLERLESDKPSNDSTNWISSLNLNFATPGISNSIIKPVNYNYGAIAINEIMYEPASNNSEFVEFYNASEDSIQIGGMKLVVGEKKHITLSNQFTNIGPKEYFVLSSDSLILNNYAYLEMGKNLFIANAQLGLSNEGTILKLIDLNGRTIDSTNYSNNWHSRIILTTLNKSLEKLNPSLSSYEKRNWNSSVLFEGATPGKRNSIFTENNSRENKIVISPNPFSPDNDGFEDYSIINFDLSKAFSQVSIKVFDSRGRLVRTITQNSLAASQNSIAFDGLDDNGNPLRIGIYILLIDAVDANSGNMETIKASIVVARKL